MSEFSVICGIEEKTYQNFRLIGAKILELH
jgi:hypothetical protein